MKFIDLFSGLGGFHVGLAKNGHECVFACEIDADLRDLYFLNHKIKPHSDIRSVDVGSIPNHDVICAGFPCQPFSLAGKKKGAKCPESGKLIDNVIAIAKHHSPKYILLENVPNILTIEDGKFWNYIKKSFKKLGYQLDYKVISPVDFGIPQNRKRVFVVGVKTDSKKYSFSWPEPTTEKSDLFDILDDTAPCKNLEPQKQEVISYWQKLLDNLKMESLNALSLVAPEFGATYPPNFKEIPLDEVKKYNGAYGVSLANCSNWDEIINFLPSYVQKHHKIPAWILKSVLYSREIYSFNKDVCDEWASQNHKRYNSWQILEWRGDRCHHQIDDHLIQFRASGIRVIKPQIAPSLISMTPTQVPIIPARSRYLSPYEAAKLQHLDILKYLPKTTEKAFKALGNAVNARIVELIASNLGPLTTVDE